MKDFNIWEGVYGSFREAPVCGDGFESDRWNSASEEKLVAMKADAEKGKLVLSYNNSSLSIVASVLYDEKEKLKILDFGGGHGVNIYTID